VEFDFKEKLCIHCKFYRPNKIVTASEQLVTHCPTTTTITTTATEKYMSIPQNFETKSEAQKIELQISWQNKVKFLESKLS
jgi:hypothetical protein